MKCWMIEIELCDIFSDYIGDCAQYSMTRVCLGVVLLYGRPYCWPTWIEFRMPFNNLGSTPKRMGQFPLSAVSLLVCVFDFGNEMRQRVIFRGHVDSSSSLTLAIKSLFNHIFFCFFSEGFFPSLWWRWNTRLSPPCVFMILFSAVAPSRPRCKKKTHGHCILVFGALFFFLSLASVHFLTVFLFASTFHFTRL